MLNTSPSPHTLSSKVPLSTECDLELLDRLNQLLASVSLPILRDLLDVTPYLLVVLYEFLPPSRSKQRRRERIPFVTRDNTNGLFTANIKNLKLLVGTIAHEEQLNGDLRRQLLSLDLGGFCRHDPYALQDVVRWFLNVVDADAGPREPTVYKTARYTASEISQTTGLFTEQCGERTRDSKSCDSDTESVTSSLLDEVSLGVQNVLASLLSNSKHEQSHISEDEYTDTSKADRIGRGIITQPGAASLHRAIAVGESFLGVDESLANLQNSKGIRQHQSPFEPENQPLPGSTDSSSGSDISGFGEDVDEDISWLPSLPPSPSIAEDSDDDSEDDGSFLTQQIRSFNISTPTQDGERQVPSLPSSVNTSQISVSSVSWDNESFTVALRETRASALDRLRAAEERFNMEISERAAHLNANFWIALSEELRRTEDDNGTLRIETIEELVKRVAVRQGLRVD